MIVGSNLEKVLRSGKFAVTAEMGPPKSADPNIIRNKAKILKGYADAMNITDNQTAIVRMSSIASGVLALEEGVEPIIQMTCRDRNRLAIQADLLGAAALGLKNLLCLTGDHQSFGNHPQAKGVFDIDSIQLLRIVRDMRDEKRFQCGEEMPVEPRFFIGCAANPFADPFPFRALRLGKKVAAGADFTQTQIVYNVEKFAQWMEMVRRLGLHKKVYILAGVSPIKSVGAARYMKNKVPGMDVPDGIVERMASVPKEEAKKEGIRICVDIIKEVQKIEGVAGVHIMAIEWEEAVPEIVEAAGLLPRPKPEELEAILASTQAVPASSSKEERTQP
jgi:methylenetetrahydrofolate reductase (NADPH)